MRCLAAAVSLIALAACKSSAPYTVPAAALNTAIGLGSSAHSRSSGGCYAVCTDGRTCNPANGLCEVAPSAAVPGSSGCVGPLCLPAVTDVARTPPAKPGMGVGISPATGSAPPTLPPTRPGADGP